MANYTEIIPYEITKILCTAGFIDSKIGSVPLYAEAIDWLNEKGIILNFTSRNNMWTCEICDESKPLQKVFSSSFKDCANAAITISVKNLRKTWGLDK